MTSHDIQHIPVVGVALHTGIVSCRLLSITPALCVEEEEEEGERERKGEGVGRGIGGEEE